MSDAIPGRLVFHSETGTEGGWYAWQDDANSHGGSKGDPCPWGTPGCPVTDGRSDEHWLYEGLHLLHNGDELRVFHDGAVRWEGTVKLVVRHDVYESDDAVVHGLWINQEPDVGMDREEWASMFIRGYRCEVTPVYGPFLWGKWAE